MLLLLRRGQAHRRIALLAAADDAFYFRQSLHLIQLESNNAAAVRSNRLLAGEHLPEMRAADKLCSLAASESESASASASASWLTS